jgi:hypothetical protein
MEVQEDRTKKIELFGKIRTFEPNEPNDHEWYWDIDGGSYYVHLEEETEWEDQETGEEDEEGDPITEEVRVGIGWKLTLVLNDEEVYDAQGELLDDAIREFEKVLLPLAQALKGITDKVTAKELWGGATGTDEADELARWKWVLTELGKQLPVLYSDLKPIRHEDPRTPRQIYEHLFWLTSEGPKSSDLEGKPAKAMRWACWVQGAMFGLHLIRLNDCKTLNMRATWEAHKNEYRSD